MDETLQARLNNWGRWKRYTDDGAIGALTGQIRVNMLHRLMVQGSGKRYQYTQGNSGGDSIDHDDAKQLDHSLRKIKPLTSRLREILVIYYASGLSQRVLAKKLKVNQSTFCRRLKKAKYIVEKTI